MEIGRSIKNNVGVLSHEKVKSTVHCSLNKSWVILSSPLYSSIRRTTWISVKDSIWGNLYINVVNGIWDHNQKNLKHEKKTS